VIYFSQQPDNEVIKRHLRAEGRALILRSMSDGEAIFLVDRAETGIVLVDEISTSKDEHVGGSISNALAAVAACVGLGINSECIRQGLRSFVED
jgi:cyanophycin synthetase